MLGNRQYLADMKLPGFKSLESKIHLYIKKPRCLKQLVSRRDDIQLLEWSSWIDFNRTSIDEVPQSEGVYKLHANMRILFIGSTKNLRQSLIQDLTNPCINNSARFSYANTETADKIAENLLDEYRNKHEGKLPLCMER